MYYVYSRRIGINNRYFGYTRSYADYAIIIHVYTSYFLTKFTRHVQVQLGLGVVMMQLKEKKYGIRYAWQWFSFGPAFLIGANSLANNLGSQSLANNRGSHLAPPSSLLQMFMQLNSVSPQSSNDDHE
ncbi:hypothetical protein GGU10DRAFT_336155 [Lentinula aff. detonsa]|uniref:Uncharacterized protein n=1 Tax=Lentinula aff. detonsa TaxID=2804958 RepID=A0AA38KXA8_9AGAR|nr:hypothetical protein GGU10DRAFT_336155 [Lentinula aff. detonsa]